MLYLLLLFIPFCFCSGEESFVVQLETESKLHPLYLSEILDAQSGFSKNYLNTLHQVLEYDLNHNGQTYVVDRILEKDQFLQNSPYEDLGKGSFWHPIPFIVKVRIKDRKLTATIFSVKENLIKASPELPLNGDLSKDRTQIHILADSIHKALFGIEGIANTHILYAVKLNPHQTEPISEIWLADYDGANGRQVTFENTLSISPVFIPPKPGFRSGGFFFVSYKIGQPKIYMMNFKDNIPHRLTSLKGNQLMPAISKRKDLIAFISDVTGNPDLFVQSFDPEKGPIGKPRQIYSAKHAAQGSPTISPDGKKIAFVSNKDGSPRIYMIDIPLPGVPLKEIQAKLLTKLNRENTAPAWSPDGKKIVYCAMTQGVRQIWIYDTETGKEIQLTNGPGTKENPAWAPNSLHIAYNCTDSNGCEIYQIHLNHPVPEQITSGFGEKRFPYWEPRG